MSTQPSDPNTLNLRYRLTVLQQSARIEQLRVMLDELDGVMHKMDRLLHDIEAALAPKERE